MPDYMYAGERRVAEARAAAQPDPGDFSRVLPHDPARFPATSKPGQGLCSFGGCTEPPVADRIERHAVRAICAQHARQLGIPASKWLLAGRTPVRPIVESHFDDVARSVETVLSDGCTVQLTLLRKPDGAWGVSSLVVTGDVSSETLRQIHIGRLLATGVVGEAQGRQPLGRPDGREHFYRMVAEAYRSAAAESSRPAILLAEENGVPVETVRRWVKEARRRGHLTRGRKGRAL